MGRTIPTVREQLNDEYREWIKMQPFLPQDQRRALRELLDAALQRSDAGSIVPRPIPSETMFMLMLIHLEAKVNELEEKFKDGNVGLSVTGPTDPQGVQKRPRWLG